MRVTLSLPDELARRFLAAVPDGQRSALVARLLAAERQRCEQRLEDACRAANSDEALAAETAEWQAFDARCQGSQSHGVAAEAAALGEVLELG
jgi:hypothetical protein